MKNYGSPTLMQPYQCFMGRWEGLCKTFSTRGEFIESGLVHMDVYWVDESTWHLHEHFENLYGVGEAVFHSDIRVEGKYCHASSEMLSLWGTELTPFNYVFVIDSKVSGTIVHNNHYFLDPNNRRIITHKLKGAATDIFQIQDFVRIGA